MEFPSNVYELCSLHSVNCCLKVLSINNDGKRSSYVSRITPKRKTMALQEESARAVGRSENQDDVDFLILSSFPLIVLENYQKVSFYQFYFDFKR